MESFGILLFSEDKQNQTTITILTPLTVLEPLWLCITLWTLTSSAGYLAYACFQRGDLSHACCTGFISLLIASAFWDLTGIRGALRWRRLSLTRLTFRFCVIAKDFVEYKGRHGHGNASLRVMKFNQLYP